MVAIIVISNHHVNYYTPVGVYETAPFYNFTSCKLSKGIVKVSTVKSVMSPLRTQKLEHSVLLVVNMAIYIYSILFEHVGGVGICETFMDFIAVVYLDVFLVVD